MRTPGGSVIYDWEWSNGKAIPGGKPRAPKWLVDLIGVDYFGHVTRVSFVLRSFDLAHERIEDVLAETELVLGQAAIGSRVLPSTLVLPTMSDRNAMMASLEGLTELSELDLSGTDVTDAGLAHLKQLTKLTFLDLSGTKVSDTGLTHLKGLSNLSVIYLRGTRVTDAGLVHLQGLTNLSELVLRFTRVTDAGMVHLKRMTKLSVLDLYATYVTDTEEEELQRSYTAAENLALTKCPSIRPESSLSHRQASGRPIDRPFLPTRPGAVYGSR